MKWTSAYLQPYLQIYRQPIYMRRQQGANWLSWVLLALMPIMTGALGLWKGKWPMAAQLGIGIPGFMLIMMWWVLFLANVVLQNSPRNTCLTPHLRRRLIQATIILWAVFSTLLSFVVTCAIGHGLLVFDAIGLFLIVGLLPQTRRLRYVGGAIAGATIYFSRHPIKDPAMHQFALSNSGAALGTLLLLMFGAYTLREFFQHGGERHWHDYAKQQSLQIVLGNNDESKRRTYNAWLFNFPWNESRRIFPDGYSHWFKAGKLHRATPLQRLLLVLGPEFQGVDAMKFSACVMLLAAGAALALHWQWIHATADFLNVMKWAILMYGLVTPLFIHFPNILRNIYRTRREQALVRLTPGSPSAQHLNQMFHPALLKRFLLAWLVISACSVASFMLLGGSMTDVPTVLSLSAVYLLLAPWLVQDYARLQSQAATSTGFRAALLVHAILLCYAGLHLFVYPLPWPLLGFCSLFAAIAIAAWRLRKFQHTPAAFPAGRLA